MKKIVLIAFLMITSVLNSQIYDTIIPKKLSENEFQEFKKDYGKIVNTNLVKRKIYFENLYWRKKSIWTPFEVLYDEKLYEDWLSKNLHLTGFSSPRQATLLFRKMRRLKNRFEKRYPELRERSLYLTMKQRVELDWKSY
jgi:hypothetical protein